MIKDLFNRLTRRSQHRVIVLMYHRIANPNSDPWQIAVSPENFDQHLQILKKCYNVISVPELVRQLENKKIEANGVCITFDDAYSDNYLFAKPLLEKYLLPATFFVPSDYIRKNKQFWWDELEKIILYSERLPSKLSTTIGGQPFEFNLETGHLSHEEKAKHQSWVWEDPPPTLRCELYLAIWKRLQLLRSVAIEHILKELREWAGYKSSFNAGDIAMNTSQLKQMYTNSLFTIGVHTLTHPALAAHSEDIQTQEIVGCRQALEDISGLRIETIAYPYGSYNDITLSIAAKQKFIAGFTTQTQVVDKSSNLLELGRLQVVNQDAESFEKLLKEWLL